MRALQACGIGPEAGPGKELAALAAYLGLSEGTVRNWTKRESGIPMPWLVEIAKRSGRQIEWLLGNQKNGPKTATPSVINAAAGTGKTLLQAMAYLAREGAPAWLVEGAQSQTQPAHSRGGLLTNDGQSVTRSALLQTRGVGAVLPLLLSLPLGEQGGPNRDYELIPKHVRHASAGKGEVAAAADQIDLAGDMAFSFEWLRDNLSHTTGVLTTIKVRGDSMATTLLDGDTIMIDEGVASIDVDGIYVLDLHGRRLVKRVQQLYDGTLVLISDNANYQRESIPRDRARDIRVIGRMVWPRLR